jgi:hypothetical protein
LLAGLLNLELNIMSSGVSSCPSLREEDEILVTSHGVRH